MIAAIQRFTRLIPPWLIRLAALYLAAGLMIASAYYFSQMATIAGVALLISGSIAVLVALLIQAPEPTTPWPPPPDATPRLEFGLPHLAFTALGMICLLAVAEFSGSLLPVDYKTLITTQEQFLLLIMGIALLTAGLSGYWWRKLPRRIDPTLVVLLPIIGLAAAIRLHELETAVHFFIDEMNFAGLVRGATETDFLPLVAPFSNIAAFPWLYIHWQATFGVELYGFTLSTLRIVSVLIGVLSIPAIYFLGTELIDRRAGLSAALFLACFPPHIHFSRLGINNIADPLFGTLALTFMARALKHRRQSDFALAGAMLGLTHYFYEGGRALYLGVLIGWIIALLALGRVRISWRLAQQMALLIFIAGWVAMPVYYALIGIDSPLLARFNTAGVGGDYWHVLVNAGRQQTLEQHLTFPPLMYVQMPELSQFYGGETPILLVYAVPFFLLGIGYSLWRIRRPPHTLLLIWLALTLIGNMLLATSAQTARYVVSFPAVALLVTLGLRWVTPGRLQPLIAAALIALGIYQTDYYFGRHLTDYNRQLRPFMDIQDAIFRSLDFPPGTLVCIVTDLLVDGGFYQRMGDYLAGDINLCWLQPSQNAAQFISQLPDDRSIAFYVDPNLREITTQLLVDIPDIQGPSYSPYTTVLEDKQFALYHRLLDPPPVNEEARE